MNPAICDAIRSRLVIRFFYEGSLKTIEPYCHGLTAAGHEVITGYQTEESGQPGGWRLFDLDQMLCISVTDERFDNRPDFVLCHPTMKKFHCRVPSS